MDLDICGSDYLFRNASRHGSHCYLYIKHFLLIGVTTSVQVENLTTAQIIEQCWNPPTVLYSYVTHSAAARRCGKNKPACTVGDTYHAPEAFVCHINSHPSINAGQHFLVDQMPSRSRDV